MEQPGARAGVLLSPSRLGDVNRSRVLQTICDNGPLARADLARLAGVARATIGNIVQTLIDSGLLEEGDVRETGHVGKPSRPVWFTRDAGLCGAARIGPEAVEAALVNFRGDVLAAHTEPLPDAVTARTLVATTARALQRVLTEAGGAVEGVGVAVPAVVDPDSGVVVRASHRPALNALPLAARLTSALGVPVHVDNDSRAQALGEKWFGLGRGVPSFASVQTGEGLGVGLVLDGVLLRGEHGRGGELGHSPIVLDGEPCSCGLRGCWETIANLDWLRAEAKRAGVRGARTATCASLSGAAGAGDGAAAELLERYADHLAAGLTTLVHLVGPPRILLHGDVVGGGDAFVAQIRERLDDRLLPHLRGTTELMASELDQRATLLGAAGLVLSDTFRLVA